MHEGHEPDLLADLLDADALSREDHTEIDLATTDAEPPTARDRDRDRPIVERVFEATQALIGATSPRFQ